ncbi:MAG: YigZ family protein [Angelakisella sp.]
MVLPYITVEQQAQDEFVERRSRFIGTVAPVHTEEEAIAFVGELRSRYKDATHNVYAYILREGSTCRFSDDGEPQGTAGKPVLEVLQKEGLTDVAVVVTRYFGGILLGTGGLVHSYTQGAKCALDAAKILHMTPAVRVELDIGYDFYGKLTYILPDYDIVTEASDFAEGIRLRLLIKADRLAEFSAQLLELSGGIVKPFPLAELYADFSL